MRSAQSFIRTSPCRQSYNDFCGPIFYFPIACFLFRLRFSCQSSRSFYCESIFKLLLTLVVHLGLKQQKLCVGFLLTNRQFREVGHCRRHISGFLVAKFYVEFENATFSCDNLRPFGN